MDGFNMRIAMMTNNYKPLIGGVPISIERLTNGLRRRGHDVTIFAPSYPDMAPEEGVIRYQSLSKTLDGGCVVPNMFDKKIRQVFEQEHFDMIHVHHPILIGYTALYLGKKYDLPVTFTYHTRYEQYLHYLPPFQALQKRQRIEKSAVLQKVERNIFSCCADKILPAHMRSFANRCDLVFAPTPMIQTYLQSIDTQSPVHVMPTGLPESAFTENPAAASALRKHYIGDKKYLFCTVSRLSHEKNLSFIINGLNLLRSKIGDCFRMLFIGDGPQKKALEAQVKVLGMQDLVIFRSSVNNTEIQNYDSACDLFLFASKSETQGIVLLEAMAAKTPVIALRASGVCDIIKNGVNGFMTEDCAAQWVNKICIVLQNKPLWQRLKNGAYAKALQYTEHRIASIAEDSYMQSYFRHYAKKTVHVFEAG